MDILRVFKKKSKTFIMFVRIIVRVEKPNVKL